MAKLRPRRARTWLTSPFVISWRMVLEEMALPRMVRGRVDANTEAEFAAQHLEAVDACFGPIAEVKVFAFVQLGYMQNLLQHFCGEAAGGRSRELFGEGQDENGVDAGCGEQFELFVEWGDERLA